MSWFRPQVLAFAIAVMILGGCASEVKTTDGNGSDAKKPDASYEMPAKKDSDPHAPPPPDGKPVDLTALGKAQEAAAAAFKAAPKDSKAKQAFIDATTTLGTETMMSPELPPREKYRKALQLYRQVLAIDPKNEEAKKNAQMIEDIYKSMNRPVPE